MRGQLLELITVDATVCHGDPCIRGTRIPVTVVLDCLEAGMTEPQIRSQYPILPPRAVEAAVVYAIQYNLGDYNLERYKRAIENERNPQEPPPSRPYEGGYER